jgi:leader peptidase (prepilin peptidase)/N-methyltransferase
METWLIVISAVVGVLLGYPMEIMVERVPEKLSPGPPWMVCDTCGNGFSTISSISPIAIFYHAKRCRHCGSERDWPLRPLLLATVSGIVLAGASIRFGVNVDLVAYDLLAAGLIVLSAIDLERMIVPVRVLYPTLGGFAALLAVSSLVDGRLEHLWVAAASGLVCFLIFFAIHFIVPQGMGFGDVRLAGLLGFASGWIGVPQVLVGFVVAFGLGAITGILLMALKSYGAKSRLPFAPFLVAGTFVTLMWGTPMAKVWLHAA